MHNNCAGAIGAVGSRPLALLEDTSAGLYVSCQEGRGIHHGELWLVSKFGASFTNRRLHLWVPPCSWALSCLAPEPRQSLSLCQLVALLIPSFRT